MALGGFCWSVFNFKQMTIDLLQAGNTAEPTAAEFTNLKSAGVGCCCTYVVQSASAIALSVHPLRALVR